MWDAMPLWPAAGNETFGALEPMVFSGMWGQTYAGTGTGAKGTGTTGTKGTEGSGAPAPAGPSTALSAGTPGTPAMPQATWPTVYPTYPFYSYYPYYAGSAVPPVTAYGPLPPSGAVVPGVPMTEEQMIAEQSYVENILRYNKGKTATFYLTYENNREWNAMVIRGVIQTAGRDHIIVSDPETGKRYLLLMVNLDYVVFDEPITYIAPKVPPYVQMYLEESREG
ncbi:spore coat protein GerQ [Hydrogenibacillus schlegelii]|nr:spore coat protein GerQ [Hydrogenibacillus schlegelii]